MFTPPTSTAIARRRLLQGLAASLCLGATPWLQAAPFTEISWDALVPRNWDPMKSFEDLQKLSALPDSDPRVQQLYDRMRKVWDEAPTVASFDGRQVKIPGFIVPLDSADKGLREFLLVPYFGACIHTPPPPANQIIHVVLDKPSRLAKSMDAVWLTGVLRTGRVKTEMGQGGYRMRASGMELYSERLP